MGIDSKARRQAILDAAARLIIQFGYNKTTLSDVADAVGLNRVLIYTYFKSKDDLLEVLIQREMRKYGEAWIERIEADPLGGTIGSLFRSIIYATNQTPFMAAIVKKDEAIFGKYLRKPGNILAAMQGPNMSRELLEELQKAGAIRQGVNLAVVAYIMDLISYGLVGASEVPSQGSTPPYDEVMETMAEMFDRLLKPEDGGNPEAGKNVLRKLAATARDYFQQLDQTEEKR
jgi:AcrR family transcriptional regulator